MATMPWTRAKLDPAIAGKIDQHGAALNVGGQWVPLVLRFPTQPQPPEQAA